MTFKKASRSCGIVKVMSVGLKHQRCAYKCCEKLLFPDFLFVFAVLVAKAH